MILAPSGPVVTKERPLIIPTPLPPPVVLVCAGGRLTATGGGRLFYQSHFKGGFHPPLGTPLLNCPFSRLSPAPPPRGEVSLGAPYGGDGSIAGLRSHDRRSWTRPTGAQDPSRQARRCHRKTMTEGVTGYVPPTPLPPPVVLVCAGGRLTATGGGRLFYKSHFKGGFHPPLGTPLLDCPLSRLSPAPPPQGEASLGAPMGAMGPSPVSAPTTVGPGRAPPGGLWGKVRFCKASSAIPFHTL